MVDNKKGFLKEFRLIFCGYIKHNRNENYACKIKNCSNKKKNGRCKLKLIHFYENMKCKDFVEKEVLLT